MYVYNQKVINPKNVPVKKLTISLQQINGRNNQGRLTVFHRGGGHKRKYRLIDFVRKQFINVPAVLRRVEYDPNRSCFIGLICYRNGYLSYILLSERLAEGQLIRNYDLLPENYNKEEYEFKYGNSFLLADIPLGYNVFNIELIPGEGGQVCRAAGSYAVVLKKTDDTVILRLKSGEHRSFNKNCRCTLGVASNSLHIYKKLVKAGQNRLRGRRPVVRGVAMNPIDHPHGGGEGKSSGGRKTSMSPWGKPTKGYRTVKKRNRFIIKARFVS